MTYDLKMVENCITPIKQLTWCTGSYVPLFMKNICFLITKQILKRFDFII